MRLGLLQLRRARRRTGALVVTVAVLTTLVLVVSTVSSTLFGSLAGAIATMRADVVVLTTASQGTVQASRISADEHRAVEAVRGVQRAAPVGETRVTARVDGREMDASLFGIVLDGPGQPGTLSAGRLPRASGEAIADAADLRRGLDVGSTVEVVGTDVRLRVVGLTSGGRFGGIATLSTPYDTWERAFGQLFPDASELRPSLLAVEVDPGADPATVADRITREVDRVTARPPGDAASALPGIAGIRDSFRLIGLIAIGSVLLLVGSFWSLSTAQQAATLAVLRACGVATRQLVTALLVQVLAVVGAGVATATAALWLAGRRAPPTFPLEPQLGEVAVIGAVLIVAALATALPAARRIARTDPVAALGKAER